MHAEGRVDDHGGKDQPPEENPPQVVQNLANLVTAS